ncbi:MAG: FAD-dependent thymidylate synthase [Candidatus Korobacteraceae bacterium]
MDDAHRSPVSPDVTDTKLLMRCTAPALDKILGLHCRVLDEGFVRVIDYMGNDSAIVQATKVSEAGKKKKASDDRALIRNLMYRRHTTPFEMCEIKLHLRTTMDVWRQWVRHRTASINEHSTQYSIADNVQTTPAGRWRVQTSSTQPGHEAFLPLEQGQHLSARESQLQKAAREVYEERIAAGVEREQARKDLPLSTYIEAYWKIDLHNLLHFLHVRMDENAQSEIRAYAELIGREIVAKWVPLAWEAFLDYRQQALLLSRIEAQILTALIANSPEEARRIAKSAGLLSVGESGTMTHNRERSELESKLRALGLTPPWN